ncbi:MAG: CgeB family protein [Vicinamibacterales bacterium]
MRIVIFCHSLISDWNHGNAHFLRGIVAELIDRGHDVRVYEPDDGWSRRQLLADAGPRAIAGFHRAFPALTSMPADLDRLDLDEALEGASLVLVHEWNPHALVERIGRHRTRAGRYTLFFHDTHHRSVTDMEAMAAYDLQHYDGVLAFGDVIRARYIDRGWGRRAWTWHEAADTRVFQPLPAVQQQRDVVWIGNWGDEERSAELESYLIEPVRDLGASATVYGVRYPQAALAALRASGIHYAGWLPNYEAPLAYARHRMTVHIPRRPYVERLPGIPTIRVFEALACGIPLVSAAWADTEGLFEPGEDFLVAGDPATMRTHLRTLAADGAAREALARHGLETIRRRHTCAHRVDELLHIHHEVHGVPGEALIA